MLASSPSPKSFSSQTYSSPSNNGSGIVCPSYNSSPRFNTSSRSPRLSTHSSVRQSPSTRANFNSNQSPYSLAQRIDQPGAAMPQPKRESDITLNAVGDSDSGQSSIADSRSVETIATSLPMSPDTKRRQQDICSSTAPSPVASKRAKSSNTNPKALPTKYELCPVEDMVTLIAGMLSELIEMNDKLPLQDVVLTRFHSRTSPGISVYDYLARLAKHVTLVPTILLSMVYYIDRLCSMYSAFTITSLTVHRFLITAATVAAKGLSDAFWNNSTYARVGGIKLAELGLLELDFLKRVDWKIVPRYEVLDDYYKGLVVRTPEYIIDDSSFSNVAPSDKTESAAKD